MMISCLRAYYGFWQLFFAVKYMGGKTIMQEYRNELGVLLFPPIVFLSLLLMPLLSILTVVFLRGSPVTLMYHAARWTQVLETSPSLVANLPHMGAMLLAGLAESFAQLLAMYTVLLFLSLL